MTAIVVAPRRAKAWDVAVSVILMVVTLIAGIVGGFSGLFLTAFTDYCDPATCHPVAGISEAFGVWIATTIIVLALWVLTIVRLVRRRRGWWTSAIALLLVIAAAIAAFVLYANAVGYN